MASQLLRRPLLGVARPAIFRPTNMTGSAVSLLQQPAPIQKRFKAGQSVDYPQPRAQQSMRIASAEDEVLPRDMGLAANTFVPPTGANVPSLFKEPGKRWTLLKKRAVYIFKKWRDLAVYRYYSKAPLRLREPKKVAIDLYREMYTAFAEGDLATLRLICNDGLYESFKSRITTRPRGKTVWKMEKLKSAKVVSNNATYFMQYNSGMRQAVVRIKSIQSIAKYDFKSRLVPGTGVPKEVTEWVVLQKRKTPSEEAPWVVWGTTEEMTLEKLLEAEKAQAAMYGGSA